MKARLWFAASLLLLAVLPLGASAAPASVAVEKPHPLASAEATGPTESRVRTLVTTASPIISFAQDGTNIGWVTAARKGARCTRTLHIRSLLSGHTDAVRIGCGHYNDLALPAAPPSGRTSWRAATPSGT